MLEIYNFFVSVISIIITTSSIVYIKGTIDYMVSILNRFVYSYENNMKLCVEV
ncbi:hypothetical protein [Clostridium sp. CCUG 7971]|uniref:hypothetical protein n=1 Tax=Clostridium sp. CCUG 7971 TaxID=2811414 RepID=UPI001ABA2DCB|nr:hypothetical protein [Clostridium sp. CCUG 7971]MBO3445028.1 hypothetical protein [Clostridium sp. CCUG 7971]